MPNYAVVIGINAYRDSARFGPLTRPVGDAIRLMEWLLEPGNAFGVSEEDLILLLSPHDDEALRPVVDALPISEARRESVRNRLARLSALSNRRGAGAEEINRAVRDVHGRAGDQGDRLYFYYAGHGLSAATDALGNDVEDAVVPADYDLNVPRPAIGVPSITRTFLATSCREQFFFFDCCRNRLEREEIARIGRLTPHRGRVPTDQYIYSATAMGMTALEGDGLFSDMLLKGLAGDGAAKAYAPERGTYEVRADRLFRYLREGFETLTRPALVAGGAGVGGHPQRPRLGGDHGGDPVLATLSDVPAIDLRVDLEAPAGVAVGTKLAEVRVMGEGLSPQPPREATAGSTVDFEVPPRFYLVQVDPRPGLSAPPPALREAYADPTIHSVKLSRALAMSGFGVGGRSTSVAVSRAPSRLTVSADDPLAAIEVLDSAGAPISGLVGLGRLERPAMAPGVYRARMQSPEGRLVEQVVAVEPGRNAAARLRADAGDPPVPLPVDAGAAAGLRITLGGEVVSTATGRFLDPDLARRLSTPQGVADYLDRLTVRLQTIAGRPVSIDPPSRDAATVHLVRALKPGSYLLTVSEPSRRETTFAIVVLDDRTTDLLVHQDADGRVDVALFMPAIRNAAAFDPEALRAVGMLQRLVQHGEARLASAVGERLLETAADDPIAGLLAGLLRLREGRLDALADLADRLAARFPTLPDAHALLGLLRNRLGDQAGAREALREALTHGLPILAPLLLDAADAVADLGVDSPFTAMLDETADALVPSLLWTARRPLPASPSA